MRACAIIGLLTFYMLLYLNFKFFNCRRYSEYKIISAINKREENMIIENII